MKHPAYLTLAFATVGLNGAACARPQPATPSAKGFGFGAAATGAACAPGALQCTCIVTSLADDGADSLRACAERPNTRVRFRTSGVIRVERPIRVASSVTIDGAAGTPASIGGPSRIKLMIDDSNNIIIRNVVFRSEFASPTCARPERPRDVIGCGVAILAQGDAHDILIDHNSFADCGDKCVALWSKAPDGGRRAIGADRVTISNNRFSNSYYAILVGASGGIPASLLPAEMRVTIARNLFDGNFRRSPRAASGAKVHLLNNVIENWGRDTACDTGTDFGWAVSATGGAQMLAEGNYFEARRGNDRCKAAFTVGERASDDGSERGVGILSRSRNLLANGARDDGGQNRRVFTPPYRYTVADPAGLKAELARTVGPNAEP